MHLKLTVLFSAFIGCVDLWTIPSAEHFATGKTKLILLEDQMTWDEAHYACKALDAVLSRVDSKFLTDHVKEFSNTVWNGMDHAWVGLRWINQTRPPQWSDNCQPWQEEWENLQATDFKPTETCYRMNKDKFTLELRKCDETNQVICAQTLYNVSQDTTYERIYSGFVAVNVSTGTQPDVECKDFCDRVMGCYMTSPHGPGCIMSVAQADARAYFKVLNLTGETYTFESATLTGIENQANQDVIADALKPCEPQVKNNTVEYIDVNGFDPLDMDPVSTETVTQTMTVQIQTSCPIQVQPTVIYATTTVTDTPSPEIIHATTTVTDTPSPAIIHATTTVTDAPSCAATTITDTPSPVIIHATTTVTETASAAAIIRTTMTTMTETTVVIPSCSSSATPLVLNTSCVQSPFINISEEEKEAKQSSIINYLSIDTRSTHKFLSRLSSAPDSRVSSKTMGLVSMSFICLVFLFILVIDAPSFYLYVKRRVNRT